MNSNPTFYNRRPNAGFTLVELLVVLVIATIVLSIAIPRIRTINADRNFREAARVVGSTFSNASQRAAIDGVAGVRITRNPNFVATGTAQQFAMTEISLLRAVPNYTGDEAWFEGRTNFFGTSDPLGAVKINNTAVQIPRPVEHDPGDGNFVVQAGDEISFNFSRTRFRIANQPVVAGNDLTLTLDVQTDGSYPSLPDDLNDVPYVIYRQPRLLQSSTTSLPDNYIVDLRYSGFLTLDGFDPDDDATNSNDIGSLDVASNTFRRQQLTTVFEPAPVDFGVQQPAPTPEQLNYTIDYLFDESGAIDRVIYRDDAGNIVQRQPLGPSFFLISEAPVTIDGTENIAIADERALWVTITRNGTTNIGYNVPTNLTGASLSGLTVGQLSEFYFAPVDTNFTPEGDRDEFNAILATSRGVAVTGVINQ